MARDSSLTETAFRSLREDLLACRLRPGERLNIKDLAARLSVSLGAVREALSRLTSEGFVIAEPYRGYCVAPISAADLRDLTETRIMVETLCLRRAIKVGDLAWEASIVAASHRVRGTPQRVAHDLERLNDEYASAHHDLHEALVKACDSAWLLRIRAMLYGQSERYRYLAIPLSHQARDINGEHDAIVAAVLARDADRAVELMSEHLGLTTQRLLEARVVEGDTKSANVSTARARRGRLSAVSG